MTERPGFNPDAETESREELMAELREQLASSADAILDRTIASHKKDETLRLDPARRAELAARLSSDLDRIRDAADGGRFEEALTVVQGLVDMSHKEYKLPDGTRSDEIDGLAQWLPNLRSILNELARSS